MLNHPNIVKLYEVYESINTYFLVLELLEGGTLQELIDSGFIFSYMDI